MSKQLFTVLLACALALGALAESQESRLSRAHKKLQESDPAAAMEMLRELQVELPGDERVRYALGCAQYKQAEMQAGAQGVAGPGGVDAKDAYKEAQSTFESLTSAKDAVIARHASFDRANCLAQAAKAAAADPSKAQAAISALGAAASAYETYLDAYPDDRDARQNLDHVRYLMKAMQLQNRDEKKDEKQDKKEDDKQKAMLTVRNAQTELPGATAVIDENSVISLKRQPQPGGAQ